MLEIKIKEKEIWDEQTETFSIIPETTLRLEHSLVSLSKWEAKYEKPFLQEDNKTGEELIDYIRFMTLNKNAVDDDVYNRLSQKELIKIKEYMESKQCATWFGEKSGGKKSREIITAEIIYYWMVELRIPLSCEKWHLNRLLTLVRVINEKHEEQYGNKKKMSRQDIIARNRALNAQRRKKLNSKG